MCLQLIRKEFTALVANYPSQFLPSQHNDRLKWAKKYAMWVSATASVGTLLAASAALAPVGLNDWPTRE